MKLGLYFLAIFFLSQSGHWAKWSHTAPEVLGFWRLLVASLLVFALQLRHPKKLHTLLELNARGLRLTILAGVLFFFHLWAYKYQAQHTRIANGMILFAANPIFTALATMVLFREKLTPRLILAYVLAIFGIYLLVAHQLDFEPATIDGDLAAIGAAAFYSAYILTSKQGRKHLHPGAFSLVLFSTASLCFLLLALTRGTPLIPTEPQSWIAIFALAVFSTLLGHGLFAYLLNYMNVNVMSCGKLLEPIFAALTAWLIFGEEINSTMLLSFVFTAGGVLVLFSDRLSIFKSKNPQPESAP